MTLDSDHELLELIAHGNEPALEKFYHKYESRVYHFALSRLHDPHAAAGILNEVMMEVWRSASRFEGKSRVGTWLLGITHHKIIDYFRKHHRHQAEELQDEPDEQSNSIDECIIATQQSKWIRHCMDRLSDDHRQVAHLAFFEELPYNEIAAILDCPQGTVKTRMFHAKRNLVRCLAAHGVEPEFG